MIEDGLTTSIYDYGVVQNKNSVYNVEGGLTSIVWYENKALRGSMTF